MNPLFLWFWGLEPPPGATDYTLIGPSGGTVGISSAPFTVTLGSGFLASPVTITPDDGGDGGTFNPTFVVLTDVDRSGTFTYEASSAGVKLISTTNDDALTDPEGLTYTVPEPPPVTGRRAHVPPTRGGR